MVIDPESWELASCFLTGGPQMHSRCVKRAQDALQQKDAAAYQTWLRIAKTVREITRARTQHDLLN
jgi:hypothetical protein